MNESTIPLISYILVGITSGVLALVTALDKQPSDDNIEQSATTMLPSFGNSPVSEEKKEDIPQAEAETEKMPDIEDEKTTEIKTNQAYPISGGKKNKKNKKTRSKKSGKKSTIKKSS
jgi:hypothetical protein